MIIRIQYICKQYDNKVRNLMKIYQLKCPNCNANLDVFKGENALFCRYCGTRLEVDREDTLFRQKLKLREMEYADRERERAHKERVQEREYNENKEQWQRKQIQEQSRWERKNQQKRDDFTRKTLSDSLENFWILFFFILIFGVLIFMFIWVDRPTPSDLKHDEVVETLKNLEEEVEEDIIAEKYDDALVKLNKMRLTDGYSSSQSQAWDEKREYYIDLIENAKRENAANDPNYAFAPLTSEDVIELTGEEAKSQFTEAGFTNIEMHQIDGSAGLFKPKNKVDHVTIRGEQTFTTESYYLNDTKVDIFYFEK